MPIELLFLLMFGVSVVLIGIALSVVNKKIKTILDQRPADQSLLMLQNQVGEINKTLDAKLGESTQMFHNQFVQTHQIVRDITEKVTRLEETGKQVITFAAQLQDLQDILKNPKQRGVLGEYFLETVLKNVLPPKQYQMQYRFSDGEIVDAVIFLQDKILPIDSKFSLENYNRLLQERDPVALEQLEKQFKTDLKNRIDETSKYIRPKENTMDFAFMFIPSEGIFYDLLINQVGSSKVSARDLIDYAFKDKHVIIVSPTSFFAYLQTVMQGLRALQIEESAKEIRIRVEELARHLGGYQMYLEKLGNNLSTTVNSYNSATKEFKKIDRDVVKIAGSQPQLDIAAVEKPAVE